jgi:hypothetical protein
MEKYWDAVSEALCDAVAIAWDECHKIYILLDEGQVDLMRGYGYDIVRTTSLHLIEDWYSRSCELVFVSSVATGGWGATEFAELIPQLHAWEGGNGSWEDSFGRLHEGCESDGSPCDLTNEVVCFLSGLGYETTCDWWGWHKFISGLALGGRDLLADIEVGYDDPREYLPAELIAALDERFASLVTIERGLINHAQRPAED